MSFPIIVYHNAEIVAKLRTLFDKDDEYIRAAQIGSACDAIENLFEKFDQITKLHIYYCGMRVTANCSIDDKVVVISAIVYVSWADKTLPCYIPLGNDTLDKFVLVIDIKDLENPIIKGYVDLTKNPIYNLVKNMDAHFQIDPADILTDWEPFAALFA
jgi:hypothetical protein